MSYTQHKKTALSTLALMLGVNAAAIAAPTASVQRTSATAASPATFSVLHSFTGADGSAPQGNLDLAIGLTGNAVSRALFGETEGGGSLASGSIFSYRIDTNVFTSLYSFTGGNDGSIPTGGLANNESNYFPAGATQLGVTISGGAGGQGTVFAIGPSGIPTVVHAFTGGTDGAGPAGRPTLFTDGNYYGTTTGGALGFGTVYRISRSGQLSTIYTFTGGNDGGSPAGGLALKLIVRDDATIAGARTMNTALERSIKTRPDCIGTSLYGTTTSGGQHGAGTIFRISPSGKLQTLYNFTGNLDGGSPAARLTSDFAGNLYGSATTGGSGGNGVIFEFTNANRLRILHDFGDGSTGAGPTAQLTFAFNGSLYGAAAQGGSNGFGDIFKIARNGAFTDVHDFNGADGADPEGGLVDGGDGKLYGVAIGGGADGAGVLFSISQ